jgi:hypothetical protein
MNGEFSFSTLAIIDLKPGVVALLNVSGSWFKQQVTSFCSALLAR